MAQAACLKELTPLELMAQMQIRPQLLGNFCLCFQSLYLPQLQYLNELALVYCDLTFWPHIHLDVRPTSVNREQLPSENQWFSKRNMSPFLLHIMFSKKSRLQLTTSFITDSSAALAAFSISLTFQRQSADSYIKQKSRKYWQQLWTSIFFSTIIFII